MPENLFSHEIYNAELLSVGILRPQHLYVLPCALFSSILLSCVFIIIQIFTFCCSNEVIQIPLEGKKIISARSIFPLSLQIRIRSPLRYSTLFVFPHIFLPWNLAVSLEMSSLPSFLHVLCIVAFVPPICWRSHIVLCYNSHRNRV